MSNEKFSGDRFSVTPGHPETEPAVSEEGVVSGEIGHVEPVQPDAGEAVLESLHLIERDARKDAILAHAFDDVADLEPGAQIAGLLDRINALRRELDASDTDPAFKHERAVWLSDIANRLRELL